MVGDYITWHSSSSPGILSPQQVGLFGGSCTGTGILMVLAARAVGLPARLTGCSQSIADDDHHWVEFWVDESSGPFVSTSTSPSAAAQRAANKPATPPPMTTRL